METAFSIFIGISITLYLISFFTKNFITAKKVGSSIKGKSWKVTILVVIISILYGLTYLSVFGQTGFLVPMNSMDLIGLKLIGVGMTVLALIIGISTLITMKNSWRMGITQNQDTELILNGTFRFSRNPYFVSYLMIFAGVFLVYPTFVFLLFFLPTILMIHLMILDEEKYLTNQHGKSYLEYKRSVNRYISIGIKKESKSRMSLNIY